MLAGDFSCWILSDILYLMEKPPNHNETDNIIDFSAFRKGVKKEEKPEVDPKNPDKIAGIFNTLLKLEGEDLQGEFESLLSSLELQDSPAGRFMKTTRKNTILNPNTFADARNNAKKLDDKEILGQLRDATEFVINKNPSWYCALWDEWMLRYGKKLK